MLVTIPLQEAVVEFINNLGLKVHDVAPANTTLPYVQLGGFEVANNRTKTNGRQDYILTLHVWVEDSDIYSFHEMLGSVLTIIDADLNIGEAYHVDDVDLDYLTTIKEEYQHEIVHHGAIQLKFTITEN